MNLTLDDAITIGLREFRRKYPEGSIPADIESKINLTGQPGDDEHRVLISFSIQESEHPFVFFECAVNRETRKASVVVSREVSELDEITFAESDHA